MIYIEKDKCGESKSYFAYHTICPLCPHINDIATVDNLKSIIDKISVITCEVVLKRPRSANMVDRDALRPPNYVSINSNFLIAGILMFGVYCNKYYEVLNLFSVFIIVFSFLS